MTGLAAPIPYQWQVGDTGNAALLNAQLYNGLTFLLGPPIASLYQATVQSLLSGTSVPITMDSATVDSYAGHSTTTNTSRYTGQIAGWYWVMATLDFATNATGARSASILKNGTTTVTGAFGSAAAASGLYTTVSAAGLVYLNGSTDYIEAYGYQTSGAGLSTSSVSGQCSSLTAWLVHV